MTTTVVEIRSERVPAILLKPKNVLSTAGTLVLAPLQHIVYRPIRPHLSLPRDLGREGAVDEVIFLDVGTSIVVELVVVIIIVVIAGPLQEGLSWVVEFILSVDIWILDLCAFILELLHC